MKQLRSVRLLGLAIALAMQDARIALAACAFGAAGAIAFGGFYLNVLHRMHRRHP